MQIELCKGYYPHTKQVPSPPRSITFGSECPFPPFLACRGFLLPPGATLFLAALRLVGEGGDLEGGAGGGGLAEGGLKPAEGLYLAS